MTENVIEVQNLSKSFKKNVALHPLSFSLPQGKLVGLIGADGSGKTTLIRLLAGLLLPNSGSISICGFDFKKQMTQIHEVISYMPQRFGLYEDLTVLQNLELYFHLHSIEKKEKKELFDRLLHFSGLDPFHERLAKNLSGGMKQKLGLACALLRKPKLMLLDEPSVGVDPISRRNLWTMITNLVKEGISVLCSTAYLDDAEKCDEVLFLNQGNIVFLGAPKKLISNYEGRTFRITELIENKRATLFSLLKKDEIIDVVIEGNSVRCLVKKEALNNINSLLQKYGKHVEPIPPRFEDSCIELLGKAPKINGALRKVLQEDSYKGFSGKIAVEGISLTKKFGKFTAVDQINFQVNKGEIFGLLGPNGAGKSTTFKMLCGILSPTSGKAIVTGKPLSKSSPLARSRIGYMAQKFSLYEKMTVLQNLHFFFGIYENPHPKAIDEVIEIFSLSPYLSMLAGELPLGYKQRLALSCCIMHEPDILFLDEPTSGVDPITRREFWIHINTLVEKGMTIIITTHFIDEAEYCDKIALINQGRLIVIDSPDSLKEQVKSQNLPSPTLEDAFVYYIEKEQS